MKKLLFYTLILITLLGIFGPQNLYAATGYCREILPPNTKYTFAYPPNNTPEKCRALNTSNPPVYEWVTEVESTQPSTPGKCWKGGYDIATNIFANTKSACENQQGAWQGSGDPIPPPPKGPPCTYPTILKDGKCQACPFPMVSENNTCKACGSGKVPENNVCIPCPPTTKEIINNRCVIKCQAPSTRDQSGACVAPAAVAPTPTTPSTPSTPTEYKLLAPLPCDKDRDGPGCVFNENTKNWELQNFDPTDDTGGNLGKYLNMMIRLFIGICGVLAVIMIVMGGVEYMTSELISGKEAGKERINHAIFGLLLALGAWTLLNTINPNILKSDLKIPEATIDIELFEKETPVSSAGTKFTSKGTPSPNVSDFINKNLKDKPLSAITVDTSSGRAYFYVGNDWKTSVFVPINIGYKGVSEVGKGVINDKKTPKGNWVIGSANLARGDNAVLVSRGKYNVGAAFIDIGTGRGIGFHGSATNHLGTTAGCIRMTNDDLMALAPYMKAGVKVIIK